MQVVEVEILVNKSVKACFDSFAHDFGGWWPQSYTWSQEHLSRIFIEPKVGGLCTEIGPHGFRIDWGRVLAIIENNLIRFTWQISAERVPLPDPSQASIVTVEFTEVADKQTEVCLRHQGFGAHGDQASDYLAMMDGAHGWTFILEAFRAYCETR